MGVFTVAVLPIEASRIAFQKQDGNAEAHTVYATYANGHCFSQNNEPTHGYYIPRASIATSFLFSERNFCEKFQLVKNKRQYTLSMNKMSAYPPPLPRTGAPENGLQLQSYNHFPEKTMLYITFNKIRKWYPDNLGCEYLLLSQRFPRHSQLSAFL